MKRLYFGLLVCIMAVAGSQALAVEPGARAGGMAGAYSTVAGGSEGIWWNDAVLGTPILGSAALGVALDGGNNALTLSQLSGIATDDAQKKAEAADAIGNQDWNARIEVGAGAAFSILGFAVGVTPHVLVEANDVSPLLMRQALTGTAALTPFTHYDITGEFVTSGYTEYALGYAHEIPIPVPGFSLSGGLALKYLQGFNYERYQTEMHFDTGSLTAPLANSAHEKSTKGTGYGVDLGVRATVLGVVKAAVIVKNLGAKLTWDGTTESSAGYDAATGSFGTTISSGDIEEKLPTRVVVGASASIPVVGTTVAAAMDTRTTPAETRGRFGLEQSLGILGIRFGYVTAAGPTPGMITFGVGVGALVARLDVSAGICSGNKGGMLGASANVSF